MKLRTSFFDKTVLKKDLTRFFPLWALYLIGGLLMMHTASGFYDVYYGTQAYRLARNLNDIIGPMGIFSGIYGFLCAQLVFGDLHNTRLCYGLHALPLRRESWYVSHVTSGLWMGLAPTLVIALTLMPFMGKFWFMGLLCFGGIALHYLFFFALAAVCMMATGNRFAATAIYGLVNFLALIVNWFVNTIYLPLLPGVRNNTSVFHYFCPLVNLAGLDDFFTVHHPSTCPCNDVKYLTSYYFEYDGPHDYVFQGLGGQWGYLWILAGIGIVLLALGLVLYRRRDLERAGDFMAFKPMKPIFLTIYSLCLGALLFMLGEAMGDNSTGFVFFVIGTAIGYFTGKMLLERTIRVFGRKSFAGMGILYGAVILSLLLTWVDPVGISRRVPKAERVEKVYLYEGRLSDHQLNLERSSWGEEIEITDPADIANICDIHRLMMEENKHSDIHDGGYFTIQYKLKNGNTVSRTYRIYYNGQARSRLQQYLLNPEYLLGAASVENLIYQIDYLFLDGIGELPEWMWNSLLNALWADAQEGHIYRSPEFFDKYLDVGVIEYRLTNYQYHVLYFSKDAPHLNQWMEEYKAMNPLQTQFASLEKLIEATELLHCKELDVIVDTGDFKSFLPLLWMDLENGLATFEDSYRDGIRMEMQTALGTYLLSLSPDSQSYHWLLAQSK